MSFGTNCSLWLSWYTAATPVLLLSCTQQLHTTYYILHYRDPGWSPKKWEKLGYASANDWIRNMWLIYTMLTCVLVEAGSWEEEWGQVPLCRQGWWNIGRRKRDKSSLRMCVRRWGNAERMSYGNLTESHCLTNSFQEDAEGKTCDYFLLAVSFKEGSFSTGEPI